MRRARAGRLAAMLAACFAVIATGVTGAPRHSAAEVVVQPDLSVVDRSADGRLKVWVRATWDSVPGPTGPVERTELVLDSARTAPQRVLLRGGERTLANGQVMAGFQWPRFSDDTRKVYFVTVATVTSGMACEMDLASGAIREIAGANRVEVVRHGRWAGNLVLEQHRYRRGGGSYEALVVVTPQGREVHVLGDPEAPRVQARLAALTSRRGKEATVR